MHTAHVYVVRIYFSMLYAYSCTMYESLLNVYYSYAYSTLVILLS